MNLLPARYNDLQENNATNNFVQYSKKLKYGISDKIILRGEYLERRCIDMLRNRQEKEYYGKFLCKNIQSVAYRAVSNGNDTSPNTPHDLDDLILLYSLLNRNVDDGLIDENLKESEEEKKKRLDQVREIYQSIHNK